MKNILQEIILKVQDAAEQEIITAEYEKAKKADEGEQVKVDETFGKPMANAEQFKDMTSIIKIGKKRTTTDPSTTIASSGKNGTTGTESSSIETLDE